jgi:hypothetical protein
MRLLTCSCQMIQLEGFQLNCHANFVQINSDHVNMTLSLTSMQWS